MFRPSLLPSLIFTLILLLNVINVLADTEILNFRLDSSSASSSEDGYKLDRRAGDCQWLEDVSISHTKLFQIQTLKTETTWCIPIQPSSKPKAKEEVSSWFLPNFGMYTARISWAATSPTSFHLSFPSSSPSSSSFKQSPYLHLTSKSTGIPIPPSSYLHLSSPSPSFLNNGSSITSFHLIVEPLIGGFLPETSGKTVLMVLGSGVVGWLISTRVTKGIEKWL